MIYKKDDFKYCFDSDKCKECGGYCCTGESGYIWISDDEINRLSLEFDMPECDFKKIYLEKVGLCYTIKEKHFENGFACIFFNELDRNCGIYEFRPIQCKTFPFWNYFKKYYEELEKECIGIKTFL